MYATGCLCSDIRRSLLKGVYTEILPNMYLQRTLQCEKGMMIVIIGLYSFYLLSDSLAASGDVDTGE